MGCTGGGRDVSGQAMPGLPREQREGDGFLCFGGDAVIVGGLDAALEWREICGEHAQERLIARASTGDDVVDGCVADAWRDELTPRRARCCVR